MSYSALGIDCRPNHDLGSMDGPLAVEGCHASADVGALAL